MNDSVALPPKPPSPESSEHLLIRSRSFLGVAFGVQTVLVLLCIGTCSVLYRDYKRSLSAELQRETSLSQQLTQQELAIKDKQRELDDTNEDLIRRILGQTQIAIQGKLYQDAIDYAKDGLKLSPKDPDFEWLLIKAYMLNGKNEDALKEANGLSVLVTSGQKISQATQRNLLSRGLAKCGAQDTSGALMDLRQSGIAQFNLNDIQKFCSARITSQLGS